MAMATTKKPSSNLILKTLGNFFRRFHLTIFFIFVIGCLAWAVLLLNETLTDNTSDLPYTSPINAGTIDQTTLQWIQNLHTSDKSGSPDKLPSGRINPFGE